MPNKALQPTKTARGNFSILLSHIVLRVCWAWLPVVRARFGRLKAGDLCGKILHEFCQVLNIPEHYTRTHVV